MIGGSVREMDEKIFNDSIMGIRNEIKQTWNVATKLDHALLKELGVSTRKFEKWILMALLKWYGWQLRDSCISTTWTNDHM
jgi:hypothetical protein